MPFVNREMKVFLQSIFVILLATQLSIRIVGLGDSVPILTADYYKDPAIQIIVITNTRNFQEASIRPAWDLLIIYNSSVIMIQTSFGEEFIISKSDFNNTREFNAAGRELLKEIIQKQYLIRKYFVYFLQSVFLLTIFLMLIFSIKDGTGNKNNMRNLSFNDKNRKNSRKIDKWIILAMIPVFIDIITNLSLLWSDFLYFDETLHTIASIWRFSQNFFGKYDDFFCYGESINLTPYPKSVSLFLPALLMLIFHISASFTLLLSIDILLLFSLIISFKLMDFFLEDKEISILFAMIYTYLSPYSLYMQNLSQLKLAEVLFLTPLAMLLMIKYFNESKLFSKILYYTLSLFCYVVFLMVYPVTAIMVFLLTLSLIFFLNVKRNRIDLRDLILQIISMGIPVFLITYNYYLFIINLEKFFLTFHENRILPNQSSNIFFSFLLLVGSPNGISPAITNLSLYNPLLYIYSLLFPLAILGIFAKNKARFTQFSKCAGVSIICQILEIAMLFACIILLAGFNGPLEYLMISFPIFRTFRSSGRAFGAIIFIVISCYSGLGLSFIKENWMAQNMVYANKKGHRNRFLDFLKKLKISSRSNYIGIVFLAILLISIGGLYFHPVIENWTINNAIDTAFSKIPEKSRVLTVPLDSLYEFGKTLSDPVVNEYKQSATVGRFIAHITEYELTKHNLRSVFTPLTDYEVSFNTLWFSKLIKVYIRSGKIQSALKLISKLGNLEYIVVYRKLIPSSVLLDFKSSNYLKLIYENTYVSIFKVIGAKHSDVFFTDTSFFMYSGSLGRSYIMLSEILDIFNKSKFLSAIPIINAVKSIDQQMLSNIENRYISLLFDLQSYNTFMMDYLLFNGDLQKIGGIILDIDATKELRGKNVFEDYYFQPAYNKRYVVVEEADFRRKVNIKKSGYYLLGIRIYKYPGDSGEIDIKIDENNITGIKIRSQQRGFDWVFVESYLNVGEHTFNVDLKNVIIDVITLIQKGQLVNVQNSIRQHFNDIICSSDFIISMNFCNNTNSLYRYTFPHGLDLKVKSHYITIFGTDIRNIRIILSNNTDIGFEIPNQKSLEIYTLNVSNLQLKTNFDIVVNASNVRYIFVSNKTLEKLVRTIRIKCGSEETLHGDNIHIIVPMNYTYVYLAKSYSPFFKCKIGHTIYSSVLSNILQNTFIVPNHIDIAIQEESYIYFESSEWIISTIFAIIICISAIINTCILHVSLSRRIYQLR
ncbi:MAG: hypothetical protein ACP6IQ_02685 [Candidatus Njordarchaeia archaeon]